MPDPNPPASIPPGATIGILGGGQLGRMLAFAARTTGIVEIFGRLASERGSA
jgi:phosphoribosylaminoimidazole carboxylase (NCAIR synthetase)